MTDHGGPDPARLSCRQLWALPPGSPEVGLAGSGVAAL